jgi:hypothetical protein
MLDLTIPEMWRRWLGSFEDGVIRVCGAVLDEVGNSGGEYDDGGNGDARSQEDADDFFGALV